MTVTLPLSQGLVALVDDDVVATLGPQKWHALKPRSTARTWYAVRNVSRGGRYETEYLHRIVAGAGPDQVVDHVDGDGLNNTKANLRLCTRSQNARNRNGADRTPARTSQYLGVSWNAKAKRWCAFIKVDGVSIYLGSFRDETEAARARDAASLQHFGAFASVNFAQEESP